ncbi:MAG: hypothetical protein KDJ99_15265 [Candidatus Competibacteraceae bacterium]|nr:hypothetical protein [Candidatus Competibacteraceae bacterium]
MAKRTSEATSGGDKAKVRVFFAEVEGNNESVQEALKTMVSAMSRPVRVVTDTRGNGKESFLLESNDVEQAVEVLDEPFDVETSPENSTPSAARRTRGTGIKKDRNAGLQLVPDLNFRPQDKQPLKEMFQQKGPENDTEAALLFVYYLQHVMASDKISASHVMTAFKEVGKAIPADIRQTIRNIKKTRMWVNFSDLDDIKMTTQGDNYVEHEMGKG